MANKTYERLDEITKCQTEIQVTLATNTALLGEHMRRTDLAEQRIGHIEQVMDVGMRDISKRLERKADRAYISWSLGIVTALITMAVLLSKVL